MDMVSKFEAALVANGVPEKHAWMWAGVNELRAGAYVQGTLDIQDEAKLINRVYAGV